MIAINSSSKNKKWILLVWDTELIFKGWTNFNTYFGWQFCYKVALMHENWKLDLQNGFIRKLKIKTNQTVTSITS